MSADTLPSQLPYASVAADGAVRMAPRLSLDDVDLADAIMQVAAQLDPVEPGSGKHADNTVLPAALDAQAVDSWLLLVDVSGGSSRLGDSLLLRTLLPGTPAALEPAPAAADPTTLQALEDALQALADAGGLLAARWRGSGGLVGCVLAMAGQAAPDLAINIDALLIEGSGDGRMDSGEAKNWTSQVSGLRHERGLRVLFTEAPALLLQVPDTGRVEAMRTLRRHGLGRHSHFIAHLHANHVRAAGAAQSAHAGRLSIWRDTQPIFQAPLASLRGTGTRPAASK